MHRTYDYRHFTIDVETESSGGNCRGTVLSVANGYVAVVRISSTTSTSPVERLRVAGVDGSPFFTEAETLMRGYGVAQRIVDDMIGVDKLRPMR